MSKSERLCAIDFKADRGRDGHEGTVCIIADGVDNFFIKTARILHVFIL